MSHLSQKYKLNHRKSHPDSRDHVIKMTAPLKAGQSSVDLSQFCDTPKDQGNVGACTSFASTGLMEYFYHKYMGGQIMSLFSEKFLYYATRVNIDNWPANEDSGASLRDTMKAMVSLGVCLETTFPYLRPGQTDCSFADAPPPSAYAEALNYQVTKYATITDKNQQLVLTDLKNLLQNGYAFVGGVTCYENFFNDTNGLIPLPQGQVIGGHAILFIGYDDAKQVFKFKNSWGSSWGDKGYGYLPYQYLFTGNLDDLWTVYQEEYQNRPFDVVVPQNKTTEFANRVNALLTRLTQTTDFPTLSQEIRANPNNSLLLPADVNELINLVQRLIADINNSKNNSAKNKK
jgi:C1A family cysteine protease